MNKKITEYYSDLKCNCGCGLDIPIKKHHKYSGIPKYIYGHNLKNMVKNKPSLETRKKISASNKGRLCWNKGKKGADSHMYGHKFSELSIEKIRNALKGRIRSAEEIKNISKGKLGKPRSELIKLKISKNNARYWKGKKLSEETKMKLSKSHIKGYTPVIKFIRGNTEYNLWRLYCFKRDNFKCVICGARKDIGVHHIHLLNKIIKEYNITMDNYDNWVTLCKLCHKKIHSVHLKKEDLL